MAQEQEQKRGPGARKVELERRLDANTDAAKRALPDDAPASEADDDGTTAQQQGGGLGHKAQRAQPHRSGRPSGGNASGGRRDEDFDR